MSDLKSVCIAGTCYDMPEYYTENEADILLADKQDALTAGTNVTIQNGVISVP